MLVAALTRVGLSRRHQSTILGELTRDFHPVFSPSCVAEDSLFREEFQFLVECRCPRPQSFSPRARRYGQEEVPVSSHRGQTNEALFERVVPCMLVRWRQRHSSAFGTQSLHFMCRMWRVLSLSKTAGILSSATRTGHVSQP